MSQRSTRQRLRQALTAVAVGSVLLTGCSSTVTGAASAAPDPTSDVAAADFPITGAADDDADTAARNALVDLNTFWQQAYPDAFGGPFQPLQGGYFSIDSNNLDASAYPDTGIGCARVPTPPEDVAGNAHFDPNCDLIAYDSALISELAGDYGRSLPAVVMAHEFGHAIQYRAGIDVSSIQLETQADCFAGAWTAWVVDGNAQHTTIRASELDDVINGFLQLRDPVGYNPGEQDAHGTYFDRVSGFADGYDGGVPACRDDFGSDRVYTEQSFSDETDYAAQGNASYDDTLTIAGQTLPTFWTSIFSSLGKQFTDPTVTAFDGDAPDCASGDPDLAYCDSDRTVYYDEQDLTQPAYSDIGDFAVVTALSLPYALAARSQLDRSTDDGDATRSAVCLTGWYEAQVFNDQFPDVVTISPGDIDEAVRFLLSYGVNDAVFPNTDASGFELLEQFRAGFLQGGSACDIGV